MLTLCWNRVQYLLVAVFEDLIVCILSCLLFYWVRSENLIRISFYFIYLSLNYSSLFYLKLHLLDI